MMKHAVIFDMDGVLVDTEPIYFGISRRLFSFLGFRIPLEEHYTFVGISATEMWGKLHKKFNLGQSVGDLMALEKQEQYRELSAITSLPPIEGIPALLETLLDRQINLSIASSSPKKIVDLILEKTNLASFFNVIVSGEEVMRGKPYPDIFLKSSKRLHVSPVWLLRTQRMESWAQKQQE